MLTFIKMDTDRWPSLTGAQKALVVFLLVRRNEFETPQVTYFEDFIMKVYRYLLPYTCTELILDLLYVVNLLAHGSVSVHA